MPAELSLAVPEQGAAERELAALVLNGLASGHSRRAYAEGLAAFFAWARRQPPQPFAKALAEAWRAHLLARNLAPATVNLRLAAVKKLAREMAENGLLDPAASAAVGRVKGVGQPGARAGNWLTKAQANALLHAPSAATLTGKRDRAILALLLGCGLRRAELIGLEVHDLQQREGRWVIPDLKGKGNRRRIVPVPAGVKARVDVWLAAASIRDGRIFRPVNKGGKLEGEAIADEKAVWRLVLKYARATSLGELAPHDLRRTCAKLCRAAGGDLEQIQLLLGHASIQTTERYLGTDLDLATAVNDRLGLNFK